MDIFNFIESDEGMKLTMYKDTLGYWTIGIGHLISKNSDKNYNIGLLDKLFNRSTNGIISTEECKKLFNQDLTTLYYNIKSSSLNSLYQSLDSNRQMALVNMCFQMGVSGVSQFHNALAAMKIQDWNTVAKELKDSTWYRQTPNRAKKMINIFLTGVI
ncbi:MULTISPECIES: glycoside hydrolase family protein [unclassified Tatumella]|uniref:glycoside hydrolase family protein n=1 Tax=unclassified Tatumella TaxID=2649542 RepID=UPI001BB08E5C|nr:MULTISPECIES: glycoside hydrolase family protein [unclassified Tatumella]MBS0876524.1 glycoside hydrolase family protein [Tatumella sp. JGM82]MBS0889697.1 glycoside hydrolase family protein [Tatumella sp. JGM94]MBS0900819.1 glycoside hydrolase family protein [Tatumella sp. JGM100]